LAPRPRDIAFRHPTIEIVAALGMDLITGFNHHVVAADSALAVEQGGNEYPVPVAFDFLEELYAGYLWHWRSFGLTATIFAYKPTKCKIIIG